MIPSEISEYNPNSVNPRRVSNSPPAMAIAKPQTYPPIAPSNVLWGLIVGKNGVFPTAFPVMYDPVSLAQTIKDNNTIQPSPFSLFRTRTANDSNPPVYDTEETTQVKIPSLLSLPHTKSIRMDMHINDRRTIGKMMELRQMLILRRHNR